MPELSRFYGIVVRMQSEVGGKHNVPHLHALYGNYEVTVSLDGFLLEGNFPIKKMKLLEAWMLIHSDELYKNWEMLQKGEGYFKIEELR